MARGYNRVTLLGNLARNPDTVPTNDGKPATKFTVAVNNNWKDKNGDIHESVDFIPVVVWGKMASVCEQYLTKGSQVLVEGRIQVRSYEAKDGSGKRYSTDVISSQVIFLGPRKEKAEKGGEDHTDDNGTYEDQYEGEDIPF